MEDALTRSQGYGGGQRPVKPRCSMVRVWVAGYGWFLPTLPLQAQLIGRRLAAVREANACAWWGVSRRRLPGGALGLVHLQQPSRRGTLGVRG